MNIRNESVADAACLAETHAVTNVSRELSDYNLYSADTALQEAVAREGAQWAESRLTDFGQLIGAASYLELGHLANRHPPEFDMHDRFGNRVDRVTYHPALRPTQRAAGTEAWHHRRHGDDRKAGWIKRRDYGVPRARPG